MDDNERFIHDELLRRAAKAMPAVKESWRKYMRVDPFFISWPAEHIKADDGSTITHHVLLELPKENRPAWGRLMVEAVERTLSYAILLAEQREGEVVVIFESPHGTHSWHYPIKNHGNVRVLGKPMEKTDVDSIGILWLPETGEA